ncbi:MAG: OmpH family outer membrane protein [Gammaproteobacteria bacterium]|nr:OmpH family outer membrane protein [Gammaproteobacteria bacterium]
MNGLLRLFLIPLALVVMQTASAQESGYKIGFVNTARVLKQAPQARKVEERLKAEFEPREAQLREKRQEILAMEDQLKSDDATTSNARRKLEREIRLKVSQLKFLEQEFREDQNLRRNEEIRELQQVISKVLKKQGDQGKFDLILTEGVSYVSDQIDITTETIEMLKLLPDASEAAQ